MNTYLLSDCPDFSKILGFVTAESEKDAFEKLGLKISLDERKKEHCGTLEYADSDSGIHIYLSNVRDYEEFSSKEQLIKSWFPGFGPFKK